MGGRADQRKSAREAAQYPSRAEPNVTFDLVHIWASPSTLHIRVMVSDKKRRWSQFGVLHVPIEEIPSELRDILAGSPGPGGPAPEDPSLF